MKKSKTIIFLTITGIITLLFVSYINKQSAIINNNFQNLDEKTQFIGFWILCILLILIVINALKGFYQIYLKHKNNA
ncbi:MAG: hypothetical protein RLZZ210_1767 [Pseudomonadota bacterium]|jgi:hypothetical protein